MRHVLQHRSGLSRHLAHCAGFVLVSLSLAQPTPVSPKDDPELNRPPVAPATQPVVPSEAQSPTQPTSPPQRPDDLPPVAPTPGTNPQQSVPTLPAAEVNTQELAHTGKKLLPEGTFVTDRVGRIVLADTGDIIFVPDAQEALLVLLPSQRLEQLLTSRTASGDSTRYRIAGQVFQYRTRTFMLPTMFAPVLPENITTQAPADITKAPVAVAAPADNISNDQAVKDPRVTDLIRDLEGSRTGVASGEPRRLTPQAPVPQQPIVPVVESKPADERVVITDDKQTSISNEGTIIVSKRGRVVRLVSEGGRLGFAVDNDPNSPARPPMILQPCRVMERMEAMAASKGDNVSYRVSGRVMVFGGKNYLLPTFFQLVPKGDITPRQ